MIPCGGIFKEYIDSFSSCLQVQNVTRVIHV